jgi:succinate-acetate transporter protein
MKNNAILVFLLFGIISLTSCAALKKVGGYFSNVGEAVLGMDEDPEEVSSGSSVALKQTEPFVPTEKQVEAGKSLVGWFVFVFFVFGVVFVVRLLYLNKKKKT